VARDCDKCPSTEPATHRVTPWHEGVRQDHLHTYTCADCMPAHRDDLHKQGFGCVEVRPVLSMAELAKHLVAKDGFLDIQETVILEEIPERN